MFFSPAGGGEDAVVREIVAAKKTVYVQAYYFTSAPIARAIVDAHRRSVLVQVVLDRSQATQNYSSADFLAHADVPTWIDAKHPMNHNKVIIIDEETVITGSYNFTKAAEEKNAENLLIIRHAPALAEKYLSNWRFHQGHSRLYLGK